MLSGVFADFKGCGDYTCTGQVCFRLASEGQPVNDAARAQKEPDVQNKVDGGASQRAESAFDDIIQRGSASDCTPSDNKHQCTFEYICVADYDSLCKYDTKALPLFIVCLLTVFSMCGACCSEGDLFDGPASGVNEERLAQTIGAGVPLPQGQTVQDRPDVANSIA